MIYSNGIRNYHSEFKCHAPGVLTGRSGTIGKVFFVNEDYWAHNTTLWVTDFFNNSPKFIFYMYQSINIEQFSSGSGVPTLNRNDVHEYKTGVPSAQEQNKIATFLSFLDERISKQRELIEKLKTYKRGALSVMFPQKGETVPRCRFASFTGDWEKRRFSEFAQRESAFQTSSYNCPSVEYEDVITEEGRLNKNIRLKETQKTGIKFDGTQVLYGKLRPYLHNWLNPDFMGVAVGDWWVLRPIYIDKDFLYCLIQTKQFDDVANQSVGSKMPRADWNLVSNSEYFIPVSMKEQGKIAKVFTTLDCFITLHQNILDMLIKTKQSLLQQLFI